MYMMEHRAAPAVWRAFAGNGVLSQSLPHGGASTFQCEGGSSNHAKGKSTPGIHRVE